MAPPAEKTIHSIELTISGQRYTLRGDQGETHLKEVAELVKRRVENLRKRSPSLTLHAATMLAAFDFASQAIEGRKKNQNYRTTVIAKAQALLERVQKEYELQAH